MNNLGQISERPYKIVFEQEIQVLAENRITSKLEDELIGGYESLRANESEFGDIKTQGYELQRAVNERNETSWYDILKGSEKLSRLYLTKHASVRERYGSYEEYVNALRTMKEYVMRKLEGKSKKLHELEDRITS